MFSLKHFVITSATTVLFVAFFTVFGLTKADAAGYFVSPNGLDTNSGLSASSPWKTINKAASIVAPGDTVTVMDGIYNGDLTLSRSGTSSQPIIFTGQSNTKLITDKTQADASVWIKANYVFLKNFNIEGNVAIRGTYNRVENNNIHDGWQQSGISLAASSKDSTDTSYNTLINNKISYPVGAGIYIRGQFNQIIGNEISHTQDHAPADTTQTDDADGMRFFGHGHVIRGNYIHDIWQTEMKGLPHIDMIQTWETAYQILFDGNLFHNPNPTGSNRILMLERQSTTAPVSDITWTNNVFIFADDTSAFMNFNRKSGQPEITNMTVANNTFYFDGHGTTSADKAASFSDITNPVFRNNLLIDATDSSGDYVSVSGMATTTANIGNNAIYSTYGLTPGGSAFPNDLWRVNPNVVDINNSDGSINLHLLPQSPLIDAVMGTTYTSIDRDGITRPVGVRQDIGAYEYSTLAPTPTSLPVSPTMSPPSPTTTSNPADLNHDGTVDILDYLVLISNFNQQSCGISGDIIPDCIINIFDLNALISNF